MRKGILKILFMFLVVTLVSCRDGMTEMLNPNSLTTNDLREGSFYWQMVTLWEGINTSYVFWEIDTVDWDARRDAMYAWAEDLDERATNNGTVDYKIEQQTFQSFFNGLIDHHMSVRMVNPYVDENDQYFEFSVNPGQKEKAGRTYVHYEIPFSYGDDVLENMRTLGMIRCDSLATAREFIDGSMFSVTSCIINDSIAYLRMSNYSIANESQHEEKIKGVLFGHFARVKRMHEAGGLKAIILDNRGNGGGLAADLRWVVGLYINEPLVAQYMRTKNGLGRYDYAPEQPLTVEPYKNRKYYVGDLGATKYVVLQDINSASMGEVSGNAISKLPTGCTIGDCTYGAHGALNTIVYDATWTGSFGFHLQSSGDYPYTYTSTYLTRMWNFETGGYEYMEGKGVEPMIKYVFTTSPVYRGERDEIIITGNDEQLLRALQYIKTGH